MCKKITRRVLSLLLCLSLLIGVSLSRPQPVNGVALSTTAAVVAVAAAVLTSAGVNYWANSQQNAISYLQDKLEFYISSIDEYIPSNPANLISEWLGIGNVTDLITILNGGVVRLPRNQANQLIDFTSWFINANQPDLSSGGVPIGNKVLPEGWESWIDGAGFSGSWDVNISGENLITVSVSSFEKQSSAPSYLHISIPCLRGSTGNITVLSNSMNRNMSFTIDGNSWWASDPETTKSKTLSSDYWDITFRFPNIGSDIVNGSATYEVLAGITIQDAYETKVTPSDSVSVPLQVGIDDTLMLKTNAAITANSTEMEACEAIVDSILSVDGLDTYEVGEEPSASEDWTWLQTAINSITNVINDAKQAILGLPSAIGSAISDVLSDAFIPSETFVNTFVSSLYATFDNHFSILSYPFSLLGTFVTKVGTIGNAEPIFTWPNIYEPFSNRLIIAAGSYNLNNALQNQTFNYMHQLYMIVVKGILSFQFVSFLYAWFCDVFHMRNSDFDNPLDEEETE